MKATRQTVVARIRRLRGSLKRQPGAKPFAQEWAEQKAQEKAMEDADAVRQTTGKPQRIK